jgi:hypothetical protein
MEISGRRTLSHSICVIKWLHGGPSGGNDIDSSARGSSASAAPVSFRFLAGFLPVDGALQSTSAISPAESRVSLAFAKQSSADSRANNLKLNLEWLENKRASGGDGGIYEALMWMLMLMARTMAMAVVERRGRLHAVLGQIAGVVLPLIELFVLRARRRRRWRARIRVSSFPVV